MKRSLLAVELRFERDVMLTRQRARQIAELFGFDALEQTRIATAVSEIARNAFLYAGGGKVEFWVEDEAPSVFVIQVRDQGPGITDLEGILDREDRAGVERAPGIIGARRLVDQFHIVSSAGAGTTVRLGKTFPKRLPPVTPVELARIVAALAQRKPQDPIEEIQQQNQELLQTLAALRARQAEVERLNRELEQTNHRVMTLYAELSDADRRKDEFLAMLAHELRNPLAPISNALHLLRYRGGNTETRERARDVMERQVGHLTRLVDDLMDVSRITRGKIDLRDEALDLVALVRGCCEDHRPAVAAADLTLSVELPPEEVPIQGDPTRLAQIVGNLLANACKFTDPGGQVTVRLATDDAGAWAEVTVRDTGIGIAPELFPHIFESFIQADRQLDRRQGGLGLGLAVVKGLVQLHGGDVWAASEGLGRGSEFTFRLPIKRGRPASREGVAPAAAAAAPLRILVVEDNRDAAGTMREVLELAGHEVELAYSGPAGIEVARQFQPEVVFCDLGLPGLDGCAVAHALRRDPVTARARLIAVSGYGQEEDHRRSREAGFNAHLTKPVDAEELEQALRVTAGGAGAETLA